MSAAQHTPGPWEVTGTEISTVAKPWRIVAHVVPADHRTAPNANAEANARLIAAAPELYEALSLYITDVADNGLPPTQLAAWEAARAALAKVRS